LRNYLRFKNDFRNLSDILKNKLEKKSDLIMEKGPRDFYEK